MIEIWKDLFGPNMNSYLWLIILTSWLLISKLEIKPDNLKIKISIIYILFFLLALFNIFDIKLLIIIIIIATFVFLEFIYIDVFQRKILKKVRYCILDYIYKIIFEYKILYFLISLLLISTQLKNLIKKIIIFKGIEKLLNLNFGEIYSFITLMLALIFLFRGILKSINNEFETYNFDEIKTKMNKIMPFSEFSSNTKLIDFAKILINVEDRSFFERKETYNWISFEFLIYRLKRMYKECSKFPLCEIRIIKNIVFIFYFLNKSIKHILNWISRIFKILNKVVICRKNIKNYMRGYSTIEMQLIRTIGVKEGYKNIFQRKIYEFIYSKIFFSSLKKYYECNYYLNIKEYKYYLIYLYIIIAPIKINGKQYKNILDLYNKKKLNEINIEEFYIWVYGLSYKLITNDILNSITVELYKMDKILLEKIIKQFNI